MGCSVSSSGELGCKLRHVKGMLQICAFSERLVSLRGVLLVLSRSIPFERVLEIMFSMFWLKFTLLLLVIGVCMGLSVFGVLVIFLLWLSGEFVIIIGVGILVGVSFRGGLGDSIFSFFFWGLGVISFVSVGGEKCRLMVSAVSIGIISVSVSGPSSWIPCDKYFSMFCWPGRVSRVGVSSFWLFAMVRWLLRVLCLRMCARETCTL